MISLKTDDLLAKEDFSFIQEKLEVCEIIKSPLRYPGGKSRAVKQILELLPQDMNSICSPFLGGGSVELACASNGIKVFGYDAFEPLVNFWKVLLEDAPQLARMVRKYYPLTRSKFYSLQKEYFEIKDRLKMSAIFFVLNRCSFSGTTLCGGMSPGHPRFTTSMIERLADFRINNFEVGHADFKESIKQHKNDFLYLDPPYLIDQSLYGNRGSMHDNFDHEALAKILKNRDGWILSYNDCLSIRKLYKGYEFLTPEWVYGMGNSKQSNEILILSKDFARVS
jgi:DNA adenine methylase